MQLKNPDIYPGDEVIKNHLGGVYSVYTEFLDLLKKDLANLDITWRFYNDSKAWLGKGAIKQKTVFWLSVWENCFKVSVFFNAKTAGSITKGVFEAAEEQKTAGKFIPVIFCIKEISQLGIVLNTLKYKAAVLQSICRKDCV